MAAPVRRVRFRSKQDAVVRARIDSELKSSAEAILATIGITPSDAFRMMMIRIVEEKALPFEASIPNQETVAALEESRQKKLPSFHSLEDLMADLRADD